MAKRTLKRYSQRCSDCSDHILSQEDLYDEIPGNSSSLDTFQELLSRARAAGEYTTDAGRHGQHFYAIVSIICIFRNTRGRFPVDRLRGFHPHLQLCLLRPSHLCWLQGRQKIVRYFQEESKDYTLEQVPYGAITRRKPVLDPKRERVPETELEPSKSASTVWPSLVQVREKEKKRSEKNSLLQAKSTPGKSEQAG